MTQLTAATDAARGSDAKITRELALAAALDIIDRDGTDALPSAVAGYGLRGPRQPFPRPPQPWRRDPRRAPSRQLSARLF